MNVDEFVTANEPKDGGETFQLENGKLLDITLDGTIIAKAGSMIAYDGDISFEGKSSAEGGITGFLKEKATSEGTPVMEATGTGHLYLADQEKKIQVLDLDPGQEISVNGNDVLAFESSVDYEIRTINSIAGFSAGGLTNVSLVGPGSVAITTHGEPLVLEPPVRTDPSATVAWSGTTPGSHVDNALSNMIGQSSDETYQLEFTGSDGFVVVQPYEEQTPQQ
ncbi:AIM24 family protein [Natrinema longum]|uniref:AIM24 family protein n=1 Tax=Natrinema longum TaxID=370324 RepID=A0A8A2U5L7_9EURY|nr:AIM24 family protein [Natrinema longum]MBZ6494723.1 AIM24 family protein [Natrinema longum]QSW83966.1 AIM24 family protein [Natrinema longum]